MIALSKHNISRRNSRKEDQNLHQVEQDFLDFE